MTHCWTYFLTIGLVISTRREISYDGIRAFGEGDYLVSTIVQPVQEMAETCVSTILSEDFSSRPSLICLPVEFADGGTTKKMP